MRLPRLLLLAAITLCSTASHAQMPQQTKQPGAKGINDTYTDMCVQSVNFPSPYGESDLKGNASLVPYCRCFAKLFAERAVKSAQSGLPPGGRPLAETQKEELAMRNTCRKEFGLPAKQAVAVK